MSSDPRQTSNDDRPGVSPACPHVSAQAALRQIPAEVRCAADYERLAPKHLPPEVFAHLAGGADEEAAVRRNRLAFEQLAVTPRVLRAAGQGHTRVRLDGVGRPHPILLAPVAHQALFHSGAELETARGAAAAHAGFICSTPSSATLEDVAAAAGPDRWFQLYVQPAREATLDLIRRAETAGYRALVVTVDTPVQAPSRQALAAGFRLELCQAASLSAYAAPEARVLEPGDSRILRGMMSEAPAWDDLTWIMAATALPVWIKGVMHPDDAAQALAAGVAGVIVSNHGGRSLGAAPASLAALPRIRAAVGEGPQVLFDGGVRSGSDVFKALALGADAVLVGRLQACALAVAGGLGVAHMVRLLREELELAMALAGCETLADVRQAEVLTC